MVEWQFDIGVDSLFIVCGLIRCDGTASPADLQVQGDVQPLTIHSLALPFTEEKRGRCGRRLFAAYWKRGIIGRWTFTAVHHITIVVSSGALESTRPTVARQSFLEQFTRRKATQHDKVAWTAMGSQCAHSLSIGTPRLLASLIVDRFSNGDRARRISRGRFI